MNVLKTPQNRQQFDEMFLETTTMIYNLGLRLFKSEDDAADFLQEVYLFAEKHFQSFEGRSLFSTWLYSLALHLGLNQLRKRKQIVVENLSEYYEPRDEHPYSDEIVINNETQDAVREELNLLPNTYRIPLLLLFFENLSYTQISSHLKIKEGTLKSLVHRGKNILKEKLQKRGLS